VPDNRPLVSVIVPVFNGEQFLRESLNSIIAQTYPRVEILVMDDASTDRTPEIIGSYGPSIKSYRQPATRGIYGNVNDGIAMAQGDLIAVYHADDRYHPAIVDREVAFLRQFPEAGAVFCEDIFIDAFGRECGRLELPPEVRGGRPLSYPVVLNALLLYKNRFLRCPTCMVRASVHQDVGVYRDAEFFNTSDLDLWLRIAKKYPIGILPEYLIWYRRGHNRSSERYHRLRTEPERYFRIMDMYLDGGDRALATPDSLAAHEAHRAEDTLMRAVSAYILSRRDEFQITLRQVSARRILRSPRVRRFRLLALFALLHGLARLPRIPLAAHLFYRRWHARGDPAKGAGTRRLRGQGQVAH
jgi:glycosyltransferase involved in cell wall biosynthesis